MSIVVKLQCVFFFLVFQRGKRETERRGAVKKGIFLGITSSRCRPLLRRETAPRDEEQGREERNPGEKHLHLPPLPPLRPFTRANSRKSLNVAPCEIGLTAPSRSPTNLSPAPLATSFPLASR